MKYTKIYRGSETHEVQTDRLNRFLEAGWSVAEPKKSATPRKASKRKLLPKVEIKAEAEVNQQEPSDDLEDVAWDIQQLTTEENNDGNTNR